MPVPVVAIVGRPNVGKSSLFNWLAGRRIAIVDPTAGVTRDRLASIIDIDGQPVEIVDTGGIGIVDSQDLSAHVERQIQLAIDQAHVILHVVDGQVGVGDVGELLLPQERDEVVLERRRLERAAEHGEEILELVGRESFLEDQLTPDIIA